MRDEPGAKGGGYKGGVGGFFGHGEGFLLLERRFDILEEGNGEGIAFVEVGQVGVEAGEGVLVGEEAGVVEFPSEDLKSGTALAYPLATKKSALRGTVEAVLIRALTVRDKYDGLRLGFVLRLSDVGLKPSNLVDPSSGLAFVDGPAEAARRHADVIGHFEKSENPIQEYFCQ